jgi:drug/metabolite transporter (DMT)-like permease
MTDKKRKYLDWLLLMIVNFMWATQAPVIKLIGDRLGPVAIAFLPMIVSTLLFVPVLWWQNHKSGRPLKIERGDLKYFVAAGLFGFFLLQLTYTLGAQRTLASNAAIITLSIPVLVAVAASFMLKEKLNIVRVLGFVLALAGVLLTSISDIRSADLGRSSYLLGNLLFLVACAGSAFYNTYCKLLVDKHYTELEVLVYTSIVASAISVPVFMFVEPLSAATLWSLDWRALAGLLELAIIVYGFSMVLFFALLKRLDVTQATLSNYVLPFFMGLLAVFVLGESVTPATAVGGLVILASTLVVTVYEREILSWMTRRSASRVA